MKRGFLRGLARTARAALGLAGLSDRLDRIEHRLDLLQAAMAAKDSVATAAASRSAAFGYVTVRLPSGAAYELSVDALDADEYHRAAADGRLNQEQTWRFVMDWLRPGETLFDLGANIGTFSVAAGVLGAQVHAFEMLGDNVMHLERATRRNRLSTVRIIQCAVSDRAGLVGMSGASAWGSTASGGIVTVPTLSVDDYAGLQDISELHTIKIDIEGSELNALKGAAATLSRFKPDIVLESNTHQCGLHGYSYRDCLRLLAGLGYDIYRLHAGRLSPWTVEAVQEVAVVDYLATTKSREEVASRSGRTISPLTDEEIAASVIDTAGHSDAHRRHVLAVAHELTAGVRSGEVDRLLREWQPLATGSEFEVLLIGAYGLPRCPAVGAGSTAAGPSLSISAVT